MREVFVWNAGNITDIDLGMVVMKVHAAAVAAAKSLQSCPTLCDPIDGSLPGSPSLAFFRQEHWSGGAISFSNAWK